MDKTYYAVALLALGVILLLLGLVGKVKLKEMIEVGTENAIVRSILAIIGILFIGVSFVTSGIFGPFTPNKANPWVGIWEHTSYNWDETVVGKMQLRVEKDGLVTGKYTYYRGKLEGRLSDDTWSITGLYTNRFGEQGKFLFKLNPDKKSFRGNFTKGELVDESKNFWVGSRVPEGHELYDLSRFEAIYLLSNPVK